MNAKIIEGDLLKHQAQYIAHQCNCISHSYAGLAKAIYQKYPYSNVYLDRKNPDELGTIKISGNGKDQRYIINMFAQYYPGFCKDSYGHKDSIETRKIAFKNCLDKISKINNIKSIAFPWEIGCGLAGGDWSIYQKMIEEFAKDNFLVDTYIVRLT